MLWTAAYRLRVKSLAKVNLATPANGRRNVNPAA